MRYNDNARVIGLVVFFVLVAGLLWFLVSGDPPGTDQQTTTPQPPAPGQPVPEPKSAPETPPPTPEPTTADTALPQGGTISGRLYDADTNKGIPGKTVGAYPQPGENSVAIEAKTDANGHYTIAGLETGRYSVRRPDIYGYPNESGAGAILVTAKVAEDTPGIDFALSRGLYIAGTVVDHEDNPVASAQIGARTWPSHPSQQAVTRNDGSFILAGLLSGIEYTVQPKKAGLVAASAGPFVMNAAGVNDLRIVMGPPSSIAGVIVDRNGNPVPGIWAAAYDKAFVQSQTSDESDRLGLFTIADLSEGTYSLQLSDFKRDVIRPTNTKLPTVTLAARENLTGVRLVFDEQSGLSIAGRVTDTSGEPVGNVDIRVAGGRQFLGQQSGGSDRTDSEGRFKVAGLKAGAHFVFTKSPTHTDQRIDDVQAGDQNVNIVLRDRGAVEGQVIDANTRRPIQSFSIHKFDSRGTYQPFMGQDWRAVSDEEGRFTLDGIEEGSVTVTARAEGYKQGMAPASNVIAGQTTSGIVLALEPGAVVEGNVVDSNGLPIASAMIFAGPIPDQSDRQSHMLSRSERDGSFSLPWFPDNKATVSAYHPSYAPESVAVNPSSGGASQIQIILRRGGIVEGVVTHGGLPLPNQPVAVYSTSQPISRFSSAFQKRTRTDANGAYSIAGLPEGGATLDTTMQANGQNRRSRSVELTVANDSITTFNFDFPLARASVEGIVYAEENAPLIGVDISATFQSAVDGATEQFSVSSDQEGYYVLEGLSEGSVTLFIYQEGYPPKVLNIELGDGERIHQDILLAGGAMVTVALENVPLDAEQMTVLALRGEHEIPEPTMAGMTELQQHMATSAEAQDDTATLEGLDPGTYTILAAAYPNIPGLSIEEKWASMSMTSTIVTIEEENEHLSLTLAF